MQIVINKVYLGIDKVHLAPMRVTKKHIVSGCTLGMWDCVHNLQFGYQIANCDHQDANCHQQGAPFKFSLPDCILSMTVCILFVVCILSVAYKDQFACRSKSVSSIAICVLTVI